MEEFCGARHALRSADDEMALYSFWLRVAKNQRYPGQAAPSGCEMWRPGCPWS